MSNDIPLEYIPLFKKAYILFGAKFNAEQLKCVKPESKIYFNDDTTWGVSITNGEYIEYCSGYYTIKAKFIKKYIKLS